MCYSSTAFTAMFPTLFLGFAASGQLIAFFIYFGVQPDYLSIFLVFIVTAGTYLLNRISDKEDQYNNALRWRFFNKSQKRRFFWKAISYSSLIFPVFILIAFKKYNSALLFALISITGVVYTVKIIPLLINSRIRWLSLKDIPVGKNIIVCIIWAGSSLFIAAAALDINFLRNDLILLFISFFVGTCNSNITSDARDVIGDQMRNIKTIPSILGLKKTFVLLTVVNLIGLIIIFIYTQSGITGIDLGIYSALTIVWASLSTIPQYFMPNLLSKTISELLVDSHLFLAAAGLVILCIVFN